MPQFFGFFGTCEKMPLMKSVPGHKIMVNKASNISDFVIKYRECWVTSGKGHQKYNNVR